jgi:hypothetical protein
MNWLKKGPDLKLSELHLPDFVYDLYYDLKERHLLPVAAVLLVALVAVPIYVKSSADSGEETSVAVPPVATGSSAAGGEVLTVAKSAPGLRDPRKRLERARALDPFEPKGGTSATGESSGEGAATESSAAATPAVPTEATVIGGESTPSPSKSSGAAETYVPPSTSGGEAGSSGGESAGTTRTRYASEAIDVRIVVAPKPADGKAPKRKKPQAQVRRNLPELTMLPARKTPAVTFMGTTPDGKKALLVVSSDVVSIFGEAQCLVGSQSCQLLALEPGLPETFVYGPQERAYRIELLKIRQTLSAKPRRASLAAPRHQQQRSSAGSGPAER